MLRICCLAHREKVPFSKEHFLFSDALFQNTFPNLFKSSDYGGKNLMFKDSTKKLVLAPDNMNAYLYLGAEYMHIIQALKKSK